MQRPHDVHAVSEQAWEQRDVARRRPAPAPAAEHPLIALQRRAGNQAVARMLARKEAPTARLGETPVTQLDDKGWAEQVRAGAFIQLFSELATLIGADKVEDVKGTAVADIHPARRPDGSELKQGLNFVGRMDSRGRCGYVLGGKYTQKLPTTRDGELPPVVVMLGPRAFEPDNKSFTLGVLRHELEHAVHNRMAVNWLKRWRGDEKAAGQKFLTWLGKQRISAADLALVQERVDDGTSSTETLANLEGFMAAFAVERPGIELADNPAVEELSDAAAYWLKSDKPAVRAEAATRLRDYGARLTGERRATFRAALQRLRDGNAALAPFVDPALKAK